MTQTSKEPPGARHFLGKLIGASRAATSLGSHLNIYNCFTYLTRYPPMNYII